ncbi:MAG TPA: hypothetical protein DEO65_10340 [Bacillus bacterium]|uniref:hypothetical protein n=1 Tax=Siminovitchia fordii TaxID=254759 RepID=UPI000362E71B|nr:hypothetical protein [Siminovitchia fordii]HBZ10259.1 hypothetical protein [Bacillus sp. (in: firmicutes)]
MKKMKSLFTFLLAASLLAACGSTKKEQNAGNETVDGKEKTETVGDDKNKQENGEQQPENQTSDGQDQTENELGEDKEESESDNVRLLEQNLTYQMNGQEKEETAFLKESDNQDFSLYVLPGYELTGEEPQKDVLYLKENDTLFMRIEILPAETDLNVEIETAKSQLESVSSEIKHAKPDRYKWLKGAAGFTADNGNEKVSVFLVPQKDRLLKLTIFTPTKEDMEDPFLTMAETIEEK